jgi:hypothetical protein
MPSLHIVCLRNKIGVLCQPRNRKTKSIFPKWWCPNCKRYVLPDGKYHMTYLWPGTDGKDQKIAALEIALQNQMLAVGELKQYLHNAKERINELEGEARRLNYKPITSQMKEWG